MAVHALPHDTIRIIKSMQVITTPVSIVKELIENSLDAGATTVSVRLENYGFTRLEVRDNGSGIQEEDVNSIAKPHYTSKISSFTDLTSLQTYGFRGEALASLCSVAEVSVMTKTEKDTMGYTYTFNVDGDVTTKKPAATPKGTTITVSSLFKNVPVRRQYYTSTKRRKDELKKVEDLIMAISLAAPHVHLTYSHDRSTVLQKRSCQDIHTSLIDIFPSLYKKMVTKVRTAEDIKVEVYLPEPNCYSDSNYTRSTCDRLFILVNQRPVIHKPAEKLVKAYFSQRSDGCHGRYPVGVLALTLPLDAVDVNLEPNKNKVLMKEEDVVLDLLKDILTELYGPVAKPKKPDGIGVINDFQGFDTDITCTLACVSQKAISSNETEKTKQFKFKSLSVLGKKNTDKDNTRLSSDTFEEERSESAQVTNRNENGQDFTENVLHASNTDKGVPSGRSIGKDQMCNADKQNNKENIVSIDTKKPFMTSTQDGQCSGRSLQLSLSTITPGESVRNSLDSSMVTPSCVSKAADSNRQLTSDASLRNRDEIGACKDLSVDAAENVANSNMQHSSDIERDFHHESLMGTDGIPVFRIAPVTSADFGMDQDLESVSSKVTKDLAFPPSVGEVCKDNKDAEENTSSKQMENRPEASNAQANNQNSKEDSTSEGNCDKTVHQKDGETTQREVAGSWSRGQIDSANANIQTVVVHKPQNAPETPTATVQKLQNAPESPTINRLTLGLARKKKLELSPSSDAGSSEVGPAKKAKIKALSPGGYDYVHGQQIKKPSSPFILFSREIRTQVLSEYPGADFAFIAKEMADRWKGLDPDTKKHYQNLAKEENETYQNQVQKIRENRRSNISNTSLDVSNISRATLDRYIAPLTPQLTKTGKKTVQVQPLASKKPWQERSKEMKVSLELIKERLYKSPVDSTPHKDFELVGPLAACGGWTCVEDRTIKGLNTSRLYETVLYQTIMKSFKLPAASLADPMPFNSSILDQDKWQLLLRLQRELLPDRNVYIITDSRITHNGFKVALYPGVTDKNISHGEIIGLADNIGFYGMNDLKEVLKRLVSCPTADIRQTRPLKLQEWMKGEAVRMTRSNPAMMKAEDVMDKLEKWPSFRQSEDKSSSLSKDSLKCLHHKPIFTPIYCLDDLPQSLPQSQEFLEECS